MDRERAQEGKKESTQEKRRVRAFSDSECRERGMRDEGECRERGMRDEGECDERREGECSKYISLGEVIFFLWVFFEPYLRQLCSL